MLSDSNILHTQNFEEAKLQNDQVSSFSTKFTVLKYKSDNKNKSKKSSQKNGIKT